MDLIFVEKPFHEYSDEELQLVFDMYKDLTWSCPPPPVCSAGWNSMDWIKYINDTGAWYP